jgi:cyclophilin family peptidyl-prolyl cis-trans isomerase/HEAT repeat protein
MKSPLPVSVALLLGVCLAHTQTSQRDRDEASRIRARKLEDILRIQDTRTIHDGKLISYLGDNDPVVRNRATYACGSLQDTTLLALLVRNLEDPDGTVQRSAAFAIGQTGTVLSEGGRERLEHELIWTRIARTGAAGAMIEEMGKFGTPRGLEDLMVRIANVYPLTNKDAVTMAIARFAIRGITSTEAVQYLLQFIRPVEAAPWQVVYALQRIGPHNEIRNQLEDVARLYRHPDPLARMHLAILLGKMEQPAICLDPLATLAEFDHDWRVRVNALRALGSFDLRNNDRIVDLFLRAFYDENRYIPLTAIAAVGSTSLSAADSSQAVRHLLEALKTIAVNTHNGYHWQTQAEAAGTLARLLGREALPYLKLSYGSQLLQERIIEALGETGAIEALEEITPFLYHESHALRRAALDAAYALSTRCSGCTAVHDATYDAAIAGLSEDDIAVVTTSAAILADSLFLRPSSVAPLLSVLDRLRIPHDSEPIQQIIAALRQIGNTRAVPALTALLQEPDRHVVDAAARALFSLTGRAYETAQWIQPLLTDFDFTLLNALPEVVTAKIETERGDITVELYKSIAPFTVLNFLKLAGERGFYRGKVFHRVVPNFVIQGGDPRGDGWGGPGYTIRSEFSPVTFDTGVLGMASAGKDTEGSQFFITQSPQPHLDGRYTVFGRVTSGLDVVNRIQTDDHLYDVLSRHDD